jgi:hypothetical protein
VEIAAPAEGATLTASRVTVVGTAKAGGGVAAVRVKVGPNVAVAAASDDGYRTWRVESDVPFGSFPIEAVALSNRGVASTPARVRVSRPSGQTSAAAPTVTITSPADNSTPLQSVVLVRGTARDDVSVVRMEVLRNGELLDERPVETDDFFANWARLVPLVPGVVNELVFRAYDELGNRGEATIRLRGRADADREPPEVRITSHQNGETVSLETLAVEGTAKDRAGVREVRVRVAPAPPANEAPRFGEYVAAQTSNGFANYRAELPVPPGRVLVEARAIDVNGLAASARVEIENTFAPEWSQETVVPMRLRDGEPRPLLRLELDKQGVNEVIAADIQKDLKLLDLDARPLLTNALTTIKNACGTLWTADNPDPRHDCSLTALGRTFRGPDGTWETSPEYALVRLLTMTPANVVVDGTSIANLRSLANSLNLGGGFNQILAETLGIARTREIVTTASAVTSLETRWLAAHPATVGGRIPIYLYDAMNDLSPVGGRLAAAGSHPGVLDPAQPPRSVVFNPDFKMVLSAQSNLRWFDGLELARGKEYIALVDDQTPPLVGDVLEFDFNDPNRFDILGLAPAPTVDLRLRILENPTFVRACTGGSNPNCRLNTPTSPLGSNFIWSTPVWQLENILTHAAWNEYRTRTFNKCYLSLIGCAARVQVGGGGDPNGWLKFDVFANLGSPPDDQYLWELISEVGQVALHRLPRNRTIAEGQANVAFSLSNIPVGMTAAQIRDAVRPVLQGQRSLLSDRLLGDYSRNNGAVDFYYRRGADGAGYLFFVAPTDPRPVAAYPYTKPGFFSDAALATKVSTTAAGTSGNSTNEKVRLVGGQDATYFVQGADGAVYRLRVTVPAQPGAEISIRYARKMR